MREGELNSGRPEFVSVVQVGQKFQVDLKSACEQKRFSSRGEMKLAEKNKLQIRCKLELWDTCLINLAPFHH